MPTVAASPRTFDLSLPDLALARGGIVKSHRVRGWWWSREGDTPDTPRSDVPTVLLVHALTGSAKAGGEGGWWEPLIGPGRAGVIVNLAPLFGALMAVGLLGEPFAAYHVVALGLVIGGIALAQRSPVAPSIAR